MITIKVAKAEKCYEDYSLFISFPYNPRILDTVRSFPTKYWNKDEKIWELPFSNLAKFLELNQQEEFDITGPACVSKPGVKIDFDFKTKPFEHQKIAFQYGMNHDRWLLGDEMGLGKTKQVIDIAVAKKQTKDYKHCLIICGVNGLKYNWYNEVHTHSNEDAWILGQTIKKGHITVGGNTTKLTDLRNIDRINAYFIITNVETLRSDDIVKELVTLCGKGIINMIAFDECHKAKNPSSQQGKGILKLKAETMIAMTGTPLMNQPMDLFIILKWLGYEGHSFYAFKNHYCIMGGYGGYEIMGYRYLDELQTRLNDIMLRRLKEDVLDLPEKTYIDEYVEMTPKQAQIYNETTAEVKANIDMVSKNPNPLSELIRMRQATGYTGILSSTIQESAKLDRLEELVEEAVGNNQQVVIFSNWTQMTDAIVNRLKTYNPLQITGETPDDVRMNNVNAFQDGKCKVIIGTAGAMGTGLNLFAGSVIIFVDHPWTRAAYDQCVDRCHRIGQKKNITIYNLLCKNTIDERIWEIVKRKGEMSDILIDGKKVNLSDPEFIKYLIG